MATNETFPIDLAQFKPLTLDPGVESLSDTQLSQLAANVQLCRDAIVFFTATGAARGVGGHTGGAYDIVPEVLIADGFMRGGAAHHGYYDEAGHRVAIQYLMSVLNGHLPATAILHYREAFAHLPGHPELGHTPGVGFSSGRLGHMWPHVNGIAMAHPGQAVFCFGSDGSQQEGNDAEAARMAVANRLEVKLVIDDNDITIAGHPSDYMPGFSVARTLAGHGLVVDEGDGEDLASLYTRIARAITTRGPVAVVNHRVMAPGIPQVENTPKAHDVVSVDVAKEYLAARGHTAAVAYLDSLGKNPNPHVYTGVADEVSSNRNLFGHAVVDVLAGMDESTRKDTVRVFDSDLEGSCGLVHIKKAFPEVYISSGVMERTNLAGAAGFGMDAGRQGIFGTFSAFLEMCVSEITMARLNGCNLLCHFSHSGVDDMADNTCHFGLNTFFADNGLDDEDPPTRLYFPVDGPQMTACVKRIFHDPGLRFVFSTRSKVPTILDESGTALHGEDYVFEPGKDELVRDASSDGGFVVSFGATFYRALDAVERLRADGIDVGIVNKPTLNVVDEEMLAKIGAGRWVLVVEDLNRRTGLGSRMGTWLLQRGLTPRYDHTGTHREGSGGLWQHMGHQGVDSVQLQKKIREMIQA
ncbi:MAG: transketolase C-terminal domain-containing protein [Thermoanaerobaculales bacterium]|nr:transketolase C-terminal domain-containing protein [Thermoanaerobaculales bacterium]